MSNLIISSLSDEADDPRYHDNVNTVVLKLPGPHMHVNQKNEKDDLLKFAIFKAGWEIKHNICKLKRLVIFQNHTINLKNSPAFSLLCSDLFMYNIFL